MLRYRRHLDRLVGVLTRQAEIDRLTGWELCPRELASRAEAAARILGPLLETYGREVSSPDMAVSLLSAAMLAALCEMTEPRRVLDAGSGFSSYVLRRFAPRTGETEVWSVDDDEGWLERTRRYLEARNMADDRLLTWDRFAAGGERDFDLVFHDLGQARTIRADVLPEICRRMSSGGILVLDDFHKLRYRLRARRALAAAGFEVTPVRHRTLDGYGRFAALARRAA